MALSALQIINRAYRLAAGTGQDAHAAPAIDNLWAFEEAFPLALSQSVEEIVRGTDEVEQYRRNFTLTLASGQASLAFQELMHQFLDRAVLVSVEDQDDGVPSSFCNRWSTFLRPPHADLMNYFATTENRFYLRIAGGDPFTYAGDIVLNAIATPVMPALIGDAITSMTDDLADRVVEILAKMIAGRGE
jgi:hypothetical protein